MLRKLILIAALLFISMQGDVSAALIAENCDSIQGLIGGDLVEWNGYRKGWNLPEDLEQIARVDFQRGGIWEYYSKSEQARYLLVFNSYDQTADANGEHYGAHDFCGPYRVTDG